MLFTRVCSCCQNR